MINKLTLLILCAPALIACASTGDYPGATPAPVAYNIPPQTETIVPFEGQPAWTVERTPGVLTPTRSYNTDGTYYDMPRMQQPGVLPPTRRYSTSGAYAPEPMPGVLPPLRPVYVGQ